MFGSDTMDCVAEPDTSEYRLTRPAFDSPAAKARIVPATSGGWLAGVNIAVRPCSSRLVTGRLSGSAIDSTSCTWIAGDWPLPAGPVGNA